MNDRWNYCITGYIIGHPKHGAFVALNPDDAKKYVGGIDLTGTPRGMHVTSLDAGTTAAPIFDQAKTQAQVIGSGLFSFAEGVTPSVRTAISDSALLAQLVANKKMNAEQDPLEWFKEYADVLVHLGWTLQDQGWTDYSTSGTGAEVHEKILEVATIALGAAPTALLVITASVNALKGMKPDSSWLTLFNRESQKAKIARFQIGLVSTDPAGEVFVQLLACLIRAEDNITQVLFFKFRNAHASFQANSSKVSINASSLVDLAPTIQSKTRAYQQDYLSKILDL
ncbi:MAG: hypothetical protein ABJB74_05920 [Gemmatimonas sp.]